MLPGVWVGRLGSKTAGALSLSLGSERSAVGYCKGFDLFIPKHKDADLSSEPAIVAPFLWLPIKSCLFDVPISLDLHPYSALLMQPVCVSPAERAQLCFRV